MPHVFIAELTALIEKLEGQVQDCRRTKFEPKSGKQDPAQLELALEDLETAIAETQTQIAANEADPEKRKQCAPRKARAQPAAKYLDTLADHALSKSAASEKPTTSSTAPC